VNRITLLTDFGTLDGYVAAMKGVLASQAPESMVEDVTHDVAQGGIRKGGQVLARYWRRYPEGTVHLVVVDPGVGTDRRGLAGEADGRFLVAPDNGVLSRVLESAGTWRLVALEPSEILPAPESPTFHGRDLFAPAAARLASGLPLESLGPSVENPVFLPEPAPRSRGGTTEGEVVEVDRFGNLATNLPPDQVRRTGSVRVENLEVPLRTTYGEAEEGELLSLVDSRGRVEVAVRNGSAARRLAAREGTRVWVGRKGV
jgi:hypothetical protein